MRSWIEITTDFRAHWQTYLAMPGDIREFCARAREVASQPAKVVQVAGVFVRWWDKKAEHPPVLPSVCTAQNKS